MKLKVYNMIPFYLLVIAGFLRILGVLYLNYINSKSDVSQIEKKKWIIKTSDAVGTILIILAFLIVVLQLLLW